MRISESKGRFFCKTNRFESIRITNRMESIRIANWNALAVISVVVAVAVRRLQRRRVSAHGMTNGTQELESRIRTRYRTWLDRT